MTQNGTFGGDHSGYGEKQRGGREKGPERAPSSGSGCKSSNDNDKEGRDRRIEREQSADLADMVATMEEEKEMEEVRTAWAEALRNEEPLTQNDGETVETEGKTTTNATRCKTSAERAVEAATAAMIFFTQND